MTPRGHPRASREAKEASVGANRGTHVGPEKCWATKRKRTWVQEVLKKGSKTEVLEMMKIELSLQPELNPAHHKTNKSRLKTGLSELKTSPEDAPEEQKSTGRAADGAKRDLVRPWGSRGSTSAPDLGWAFIYRH